MVSSKRTQLGRPPASSSTETRKRILEVARRSFAERGYEATTNRIIAEGADITTGAIYHYFDSKLDIFKAVMDEVADLVHARFIAAEATPTTFVGKLEAVMEAFHQLNDEDASIAQFVGAARIDQRRLAGVLGDLPGGLDGDGYYLRLIDGGIGAGEIDPEHREALRHFMRAVAVGLTDGVSGNQEEHRLALDGLSLVINGGLANKA